MGKIKGKTTKSNDLPKVSIEVNVTAFQSAKKNFESFIENALVNGLDEMTAKVKATTETMSIFGKELAEAVAYSPSQSMKEAGKKLIDDTAEGILASTNPESVSDQEALTKATYDWVTEGNKFCVIEGLQVGGMWNQVVVSKGKARVKGNDFELSDNTPFVIDPPEKARIDSIILRHSFIKQLITLEYLVGVEGITEIPPPLKQYGDIWEMHLCNIHVPAGGGFIETIEMTAVVKSINPSMSKYVEGIDNFQIPQHFNFGSSYQGTDYPPGIITGDIHDIQAMEEKEKQIGTVSIMGVEIKLFAQRRLDLAQETVYLDPGCIIHSPEMTVFRKQLLNQKQNETYEQVLCRIWREKGQDHLAQWLEPLPFPGVLGDKGIVAFIEGEDNFSWIIQGGDVIHSWSRNTVIRQCYKWELDLTNTLARLWANATGMSLDYSRFSLLE